MPITTTQLLDAQGTNDVISVAEAQRRLHERSVAVTRRTLSFWQESQLIPAAMRVGSRGGVVPICYVDLVEWISAAKAHGLRSEVIVELQPVWLYLAKAEHRLHLDVGELERIARSSRLSHEANFYIPQLVNHVMAGLCPDCLSRVEWRLKDNTVVHHDTDNEVKLHFVIGEIDPATGHAHAVAWTQMTLPGIGREPDLDDPALIVLGLPMGVRLGSNCGHAGRRRRHRPQRPAACHAKISAQNEASLF